ncbi:MmcQ/YjbR family DNA-binding protein [Streptomyces sp. NPDC003006]
MTPEELRTFCLSFNDVVEDFPFTPETSVFKVAGKMFALSHMNKRHWNTVTADGDLPDEQLRELIEDSYDLVVAGLPRAQRLRREAIRSVAG